MTTGAAQNSAPADVTECNVTRSSQQQGCDMCGGTGYLWLNHLRRLPPCPVCRGAGLLADTDERKQARVEHEREQRHGEREQHEQIRDIVFGHYGRSCACCGTTERLTIDHVNGDGREHRAEIAVSGGGSFYRWLIRNGFPDGLQTLCAPCNSSKFRGEHCRRWHEKGA